MKIDEKECNPYIKIKQWYENEIERRKEVLEVYMKEGKIKTDEIFIHLDTIKYLEKVVEGVNLYIVDHKERYL